VRNPHALLKGVGVPLAFCPDLAGLLEDHRLQQHLKRVLREDQNTLDTSGIGGAVEQLHGEQQRTQPTLSQMRGFPAEPCHEPPTSPTLLIRKRRGVPQQIDCIRVATGIFPQQAAVPFVLIPRVPAAVSLPLPPVLSVPSKSLPGGRTGDALPPRPAGTRPRGTSEVSLPCPRALGKAARSHSPRTPINPREEQSSQLRDGGWARAPCAWLQPAAASAGPRVQRAAARRQTRRQSQRSTAPQVW
jgi:hypothetical protein